MFDFNYKINNDIFNDLYQLNRYFTKNLLSMLERRFKV